MKNEWNAEGINQKIKYNVNRIYKSIDRIKKFNKSKPSYELDLSTCLGRLEANLSVQDDSCLTSKVQFLDRLKDLKSNPPENIVDKDTLLFFKLGWISEILILTVLEPNKGQA